MRELQAETGWPVEWQARETVATWTLRQFGRVPKRDDTMTVGEYRITVLEANAERARRVRIERSVSEGKDLVA
jgi:CBS domain containing-hemolysin-like protein